MAKTKSELASIAAIAQWFGVVITVAALFFARDVFIPLALGLLLSFLLSPIVNRLQRFGVPNVLAVIATASLAFLTLAGVFTLLGRELSTLVHDLPDYKHELVDKARGMAGVTGGVGGSIDELAEEVTEAIEEGEASPEPSSRLTLQWLTDEMLPFAPETNELPHDGTSVQAPIYVKTVDKEWSLATWATTAGTLLGPMATAGLVTVFALFMLIHREDLRDRIIAVISHGDYVTTTEALDEAGRRISRYLIAQTIINTGYGITFAAGLLTIGATMTADGFPNAMMWGLLATCLRFVPYLGPTAAAVFPSTIALAVFPGYSVFLVVVAMIAVMELVCNNVVEPWLYGTSTGISAVAVIAAAVFWGWLWGPVGLLLSTPLTVCLVVLGRYVPRFKMIATLLGEDVEIRPAMRFYQRLLASDQRRAEELLARHLEDHGLPQTADEVIIPALKRIRVDAEDEHLSDADANRLLAMAGGLIAAIKPDANEAGELEKPTRPMVLGYPSHHFSETLVLNLIRNGSKDRFEVESLDDDAVPSNVARRVANETPLVVVIAVLPPGGFAQARYLSKTIREEGYSGAIIVACLGKFKNYDRLFVKFRKAGVTSMTTSYTQTLSKIESLLDRTDQPRLPVPPSLAAVVTN